MNDIYDPAKPGRPKLPSGERRSARVVTMVTETEHDALQSIAKQTGTSLSALCHAILVKAVSLSPSEPHEKRHKSKPKEK